MCAQQFGLNAQDIAIAAAEMKYRFDSRLLLDELASDLRAQTGAGTGAIRNIDAIDAVLSAQLAPAISLRGINAARRQNFDERDELARSQLRAELRFLRDRHFGKTLDFRLAGSSTVTAVVLPLQRLQRADLTANLLDVFRGGATAAADDAHASPQKPPRILGHVFGRTEINVAAFDVAGSPALGMALRGLEVSAPSFRWFRESLSARRNN